MKIKEIVLEAPPVILNPLKADVPKNGSMSITALEREYQEIGTAAISPIGDIVLFIDSHQSHIAGILKRDIDSGKTYLEQPFRLLLKSQPTITVSDQFPDPIQVDWVAVDEKYRSMTVATQIYAAITRTGYTMLSDNEQFPPGAALWLKIAKTYGVYVADGEGLWGQNGVPVIYTGGNIPHDRIWSKQPNFLRSDVVLILSPDRVS